MSETPDMFTDQQGVLVAQIPASRNREPNTQNTVSGQMAVSVLSTNLATVAPDAKPSASVPSSLAVGVAERECDFDGATFDPEQDRTRLKAQLVRVRECMRDGKWRSLAEIAKITGDPESSISARLRDCRKPKFGLWTVNRLRDGGTFFYSLRGKGI